MERLSAETKKTGKGRRTRNPPPGQDLFARLCASSLGAECVREYRFHPVRRWRFDYAVPERKIALEVEGGVWTGGRHVRPKGFLGDIEKYNTAALMGWRVFRVTPGMLADGGALRLLRRAAQDPSAQKDGGFDP